MEVIIKYTEGMAFSAIGESGHWVGMDHLKAFGGSESASMPMELILMGLGGCTGMDVLAILKKMKINLDDFRIDITAEQAEDYPKVFTHIHLKYHLYGVGIDPDKVERAIDLSQDKYCSVSAMLRKTATIDHVYEIHPRERKQGRDD